MAILAIHTDCFKLLILAISWKNLGDEYPDSTGNGKLQPELFHGLAHERGEIGRFP